MAAEASSRRGTQRQCQLRSQILVGDAAHPVGAKQSTHADKLLITGAQRANHRHRGPCRRRIGTQTRLTARIRVDTGGEVACLSCPAQRTAPQESRAPWSEPRHRTGRGFPQPAREALSVARCALRLARTVLLDQDRSEAVGANALLGAVGLGGFGQRGHLGDVQIADASGDLRGVGGLHVLEDSGVAEAHIDQAVGSGLRLRGRDAQACSEQQRPADNGACCDVLHDVPHQLLLFSQEATVRYPDIVTGFVPVAIAALPHMRRRHLRT